MDNKKNLIGKSISLLGSSVVNDIGSMDKDIIDSNGRNELYVSFPAEISISLKSDNDKDTDYITIPAGAEMNMSNIFFKNIKIKSVTIQTGFIYTAVN